MAAPDPSSGGWLEALGAGAVLMLTLGSQAWTYFKEINKKEAPKQVVLETAELADMQPVREVLKRLERIMFLETDWPEHRRMTTEMHAILERMERQSEIRSLLREEKLRDDDRNRRP